MRINTQHQVSSQFVVLLAERIITGGGVVGRVTPQ